MRKYFIFNLIVISILIFSLAGMVYSQNSTELLWNDVQEESIIINKNRLIIPDSYRTLRLDFTGVKSLLQNAPKEENVRVQHSSFIISLPMPNGEFQQFKIVESPIMAEELGDKYHEIKTYLGQGINDKTATVRFDYTHKGFHAMILSVNGSVFIDPYSQYETEFYLSYFERDFSPKDNRLDFNCTLLKSNSLGVQEVADLIAASVDTSFREGLRTYRLAVACTGEYTQFHGGEVADGIAAIVVAINRVTGIFEVEIAVRFELVPNNDLIVYTDPNTDPYMNNDLQEMVIQNQANIDLVIGRENYDVGHVLGTNGGGLGFLCSVCSDQDKARGVSSNQNPIGDPFFINTLAHELGHQFGGNHTFNGTIGPCSLYRVGSSAYEPGSGSTIMSYAGICSSQNLQVNPDPYFHNISFVQMVNYTRNGLGNNCPVITSTGNSLPVVDAGPGGYTIPIETPFILTGSAIDRDGDSLTYNWEEFDLGPAGHPNSPEGNAPIFRSFPATTESYRIFPQISAILNNWQIMGEILPTYSRNLRFRLTVRDNRAGGGGVGYDEMTMSVTSSAGPFLVSSPNTNLAWQGNSIQTIIWDVANTNVPPVNVTEVNILLSTDSGHTWPIILAYNTPNDGLELVLIPNVPTTTARVKVESVGNVFFDISNRNFTIVDNPVNVDSILFNSAPYKFALYQNHPNPFNPSTIIKYEIKELTNVKLTVFDVLGNDIVTLVNEEKSGGLYEYTFDGSGLNSGVYFYQLEVGEYIKTKKMVLIK